MDKNKIVAALLAFFIGYLGIHKFSLGVKGGAKVYHLGGGKPYHRVSARQSCPDYRWDFPLL